jgi:hypothetical protein
VRTISVRVEGGNIFIAQEALAPTAA